MFTKHNIRASLRNINSYGLITGIVALGLVVLCIDDISRYGLQILHWDLLLISGAVVFIVAIQMAFKIPAKFDEMLNRLAHRGSLQTTGDTLQTLKARLRDTGNKLSVFMGAGFAFLMLFSFFFRFGFSIPAARIPITLLECGGGFIAGVFLGRMYSYGRLGWLLTKHGIAIHIQPGHLDEVGGLRPVGDFYFQQAMVVALPAVFLAIWLLIMQFVNTRYTGWKTPYAILLSVNIIIEVLVFILPLLSFHSMMVVEKQKQLEEADELSKEIAVAEHQLAGEQDVQQRELVKDRLSFMTKEYWNIERLPTWPISKKTKKVFKNNNFSLLVPLLLDLISRTSIGKTPWWQEASGIVEKVFK